jgi:hypothetical protein
MTTHPGPRVVASAVLLAAHLVLLVMFSVAADVAGSWGAAPIGAAAIGCLAMTAVLGANLMPAARSGPTGAAHALAAVALWLCATGTVVLLVAGTVALLTAPTPADAEATVTPIALAALALAFGLIPTAATRQAMRPE